MPNEQKQPITAIVIYTMHDFNSDDSEVTLVDKKKQNHEVTKDNETIHEFFNDRILLHRIEPKATRAEQQHAIRGFAQLIDQCEFAKEVTIVLNTHGISGSSDANDAVIRAVVSKIPQTVNIKAICGLQCNGFHVNVLKNSNNRTSALGMLGDRLNNMGTEKPRIFNLIGPTKAYDPETDKEFAKAILSGEDRGMDGIHIMQIETKKTSFTVDDFDKYCNMKKDDKQYSELADKLGKHLEPTRMLITTSLDLSKKMQLDIPTPAAKDMYNIIKQYAIDIGNCKSDSELTIKEFKKTSNDFVKDPQISKEEKAKFIFGKDFNNTQQLHTQNWGEQFQVDNNKQQHNNFGSMPLHPFGFSESSQKTLQEQQQQKWEKQILLETKIHSLSDQVNRVHANMENMENMEDIEFISAAKQLVNLKNEIENGIKSQGIDTSAHELWQKIIHRVNEISREADELRGEDLGPDKSIDQNNLAAIDKNSLSPGILLVSQGLYKHTKKDEKIEKKEESIIQVQTTNDYTATHN